MNNEFNSNSKNVVCFLCDHEFQSNEESWMIFNQIYFKKNQIITTLSQILSALLGYKIDEKSAHSIFLCTNCKIMTLEYKSTEQQYKKLRNLIVTTYNRTVKIYRFNEKVNVKIETQLANEYEGILENNEIIKQQINEELGQLYLHTKNDDTENDDTLENINYKMERVNNSNTVKQYSNEDDEQFDPLLEEIMGFDNTTVNTNVYDAEEEEEEKVTEDEEEEESVEEEEEEEEEQAEEELVEEKEELFEEKKEEEDEAEEVAVQEEGIEEGVIENVVQDEEDDVKQEMEEEGDENVSLLNCDGEFSSDNESLSATSNIEDNIESQKLEFPNSNENLKSTTDTMKNFLCKICGKKLANKYTLKTHMETQHDWKESNKNIEKNSNPDGYKCKICGKIMPHKKSLNLHIARHNTDRKRPYECDICFKKFFHPFNLKRHKMIHSVIQRPFICDVCNKGFLENSKLIYHKKKHLNSKIFLYHCELCNKPLSNKSDLPRHKELFCEVIKQQNMSMIENLKKVNCVKCGKKFVKTKENLTTDRKSLQCEVCDAENSDSEIEIDENILRSVYKCEECGKLFAAKSTLNLHMKMHTNDNDFKRPLSPLSENEYTTENARNDTQNLEKSNVCEKCGKCFATLKTLNHHMELHNEVFYECDICKVNFPHKRNLILHRNFHIKKNQPKYECDVCQKKFGTRGKLKQHIQVHSNQTFECDDCGKVFSQLRYLRNHKKDKINRRLYQCEICDKSFSMKTSLTEHEGTHVDESEYQFQCENCKKKFYTITELKRHKLKHSNDVSSSFICEFCKKHFLSKNALDRHEAGVHLGIRKYLCDLCGKSFPYPGSLRSHYAVHSSEYPFACHICKRPFKNRNRLLTHIKYSKHKKNQKFKPKNEI